MTDSSYHTVTQLLSQFNSKKTDVSDELFRQVYDELYILAKKQRKKWSGNHTLNTTSLVHEAYLKLVDKDLKSQESRAHFFATAAKAMRHILVNYARDQKRKKRGGDRERITLDEFKFDAISNLNPSNQHNDLLLVLENALRKLEEISPRQSQIIECRFFGGMTIEDTAIALEISAATVKRGWKTSQLWLYREMKKRL